MGETGQRASSAGAQDELVRLHARVAPRFTRPEVRERVGRYLAGLLGPVERRTGWRMAERIGESRPDGAQRLLNKARWDAELVRDDLRDYVVERLGDQAGVLAIVEAGFSKKGAKSVGVAEQHNPSTGRVENCQVGVFLAYASPRGWAFIDRALYLPEGWSEDAERRRVAGVPEDVGFVTKSELARQMIERALEAGVTAAWVSGGEAYGKDEELRCWLEARGQSYLLEVMRSRGVLSGAESVLPPEWEWVQVNSGNRVDRVYKWGYGPLSHEAATRRVRWLLARRSVARPGEQDYDGYAYYRAYGPNKTLLAGLVRAAAARWTIQEGLEQAKGEVGLDQYEVRRWEAWHRHVTLCLLAHASLQLVRAGER